MNPEAKEKLLKETKCLLRSLVESSPRGMLLKSVLSEYREMVGEQLPFRKLGFSTVEEFVSSISDTVRLLPSSSRDNPLLACVKIKETAHLDKLVQEQKKDKKKTEHIRTFRRPPSVPASPASNVGKPLSASIVKSRNAPSPTPTPKGPQSNKPKETTPSVKGPFPGASPAPAALAPLAELDVGTSNELPARLLQDVKAILENPEHANGMPWHKLQAKIKERSGYHLYPEMFGSVNPFQLVDKRMRSVAKVKNTGQEFVIIAANAPGPSAVPPVAPMHRAARAPTVPPGHRTSLMSTPPSLDVVTLPVSSIAHYNAALLNLCYAYQPVFTNQWGLAQPTLRYVLQQPLPCAPSPPPPYGSLYPVPPQMAQPRRFPPGFAPIPTHAGHNAVIKSKEVREKRESVPSFQNDPSRSDSAAASSPATASPTPVAGNRSPASPMSAPESSYKPYVEAREQEPKRKVSSCIELYGQETIISREEEAQNPLADGREMGEIGEEEGQGIAGWKNCIPDSIKSKLEKVLSMRPLGLWSSQLESAFLAVNGSQLDLQALGFESSVELAWALPDLFFCRLDYDRGDWFLVKNPEPPSTGSFAGMEENYCNGVDPSLSEEESKLLSIFSSNGVTPEVLSRLLQIVCSAPGGFPVSRFKEQYKTQFVDELDLTNGKFWNLELLFMTLENHNHVKIDKVQDRDGGKVLIFPLQGAYKLLEKIPTKQLSRYLSTYPADAVTKEERYKVFSLPQIRTEEESQLFDAFVAFHIDPGKFFLNFLFEDTWTPFREMMHKIQPFCNSDVNRRIYHVREEFLCSHLPCLALYSFDQEWYRAVITRIPSTGKVEVMYIDFGNIETLPLKDILLMKRQFFDLPAQAVVCTLHGIEPKTGLRWSSKAIELFKYLTYDKKGKAKIFSSKGDIKIVDFYTCEGSRTSIAERLVEDGHAVYSDIKAELNKLKAKEGEMRNTKSSPEFTKKATANSDVMSDKDDVSSFKIKSTDVCGRSFDLIRVDGLTWVPNFQLSKLFNWPSDRLLRMATVSNLKIDFRKVTKEVDVELHTKVSRLSDSATTYSDAFYLCPLQKVQEVIAKFSNGKLLINMGQAFKQLAIDYKVSM